MKEYSFVVFRAFLQYIYTDTVNVSPEDAIGELFVLIYGYVLYRHLFCLYGNILLGMYSRVVANLYLWLICKHCL